MSAGLGLPLPGQRGKVVGARIYPNSACWVGFPREFVGLEGEKGTCSPRVAPRLAARSETLDEVFEVGAFCQQRASPSPFLVPKFSLPPEAPGHAHPAPPGEIWDLKAELSVSLLPCPARGSELLLQNAFIGWAGELGELGSGS